MNNDFKPKRRKLTLLKIMVAAVVVVTITAAVVLPELAKANNRRQLQKGRCVNNLKQLGIAFRGFGIDLGGFPMTVSADTNRSTESNSVRQSTVALTESPTTGTKDPYEE